MPPRVAIPRLAPTIRPHHRTFILPSSGPQRFTTSRHLPYPAKSLYSLVTDIDSYSSFLPFCTRSTVTSRSPTNGLPTSADLHVGYNAYQETFNSVVRCDVDNLSCQADASHNDIFEVLVARWRVIEEGGNKGSEVQLGIEWQFRNPLYGALSSAVTPKVAEMLVQAFDKRAHQVLGGKKGRVGGVVEGLKGGVKVGA